MSDFTRTIAALAVMILSTAPAAAWPDKPITLVVPFAAGGTNDTLSRILAEHMAKTIGGTIVIENEAGAAGTTAAARVARSEPDGTTLIMGNMGTHATAPLYYPQLKYDPVTDFTPIGLTAEVPAVVVARKDFPATDLASFAAYVRQNQDKLNEAHVGVGAPTHTFCTLLQSLMGTKTGRVAYRGGAQAMTDLVAGQVDFSCISLSGAIGQIQGGSLKAIVIASPTRADIIKSVPTARESGMPEFEVSTWNALFAAKGTPDARRDTLQRALDAALDDASVRTRLLDLGIVIPAKADRTPQVLAARVTSEMKRWATLLGPAGVAAK